MCNACTSPNQAICESCSMCYTARPAFSWSFYRYRNSLSICTVSRFFTTILSGALTGVFALVGSFTGAFMGALAGHAAHSGLLRGAGLGAVAGAVLSVEVLEASRSHWHAQHSGSSSSLSPINFFEDLISGRFFQDFVVPSFSAAQSWQVNFAEMSYEDLYDLLLPAEGRVKGASQELLQSLPRHTVTEGNRIDAYGDVRTCAICLQELEQGDIARALPACKHTFHMKCVDQWLLRRVVCPVCRQHAM